MYFQCPICFKFKKLTIAIIGVAKLDPNGSLLNLMYNDLIFDKLELLDKPIFILLNKLLKFFLVIKNFLKLPLTFLDNFLIFIQIRHIVCADNFGGQFGPDTGIVGKNEPPLRVLFNYLLDNQHYYGDVVPILHLLSDLFLQFDALGELFCTWGAV